MAPSNLVKIDKPIISIEEINSIISQAQTSHKELLESRRTILDLKMEIQKERDQKHRWEQKYSKLEIEITELLERLRDMEVELNIYKSHHSRDSSVNLSLNLSPDVEPLAGISLESTIIVGEKMTEKESEESIHEFEDIVNGIEQEHNTSNNVIQKLMDAQICIDQLKNYDVSMMQKLMDISIESL
jgi:uncharacterized coiled-coil DUF342 family protein